MLMLVPGRLFCRDWIDVKSGDLFSRNGILALLTKKIKKGEGRLFQNVVNQYFLFLLATRD